MVVCRRTPRFEQFVRRHSGSVKLGHRILRIGCSRSRRENFVLDIRCPSAIVGSAPLPLTDARAPPVIFFFLSSSLSPDGRIEGVWARAAIGSVLDGRSGGMGGDWRRRLLLARVAAWSRRLLRAHYRIHLLCRVLQALGKG